MAFIVIESYTCKQDDIEKIKKVFLASLYLFDNIDGIKNIEMLEELDDPKIVGITTWKSKEAFDEFLKSDKMIELLESAEMQTIKELMCSFDVKMYNKIELN